MNASSGAEGLQQLAGGKYGGVISDIRMPGAVNGAEVHDWIQKNRPELGYEDHFISGDTANSETQALSGAQRDTLHREAVPCASINILGGENLRETMSDDLKVRLLVVDDEQSIRRLCMTIGNTLGYSCMEAESAEAALAKLDSDAPDLVLTDLKLPTLSGVELLRQVKMIFRERRWRS